MQHEQFGLKLCSTCGSEAIWVSDQSPVKLPFTLTGCYFRHQLCKKQSLRRYYHCSHRKLCGRTGKKTGSECSKATGCVWGDLLFPLVAASFVVDWQTEKSQQVWRQCSEWDDWCSQEELTVRVKNILWLPWNNFNHHVCTVGLVLLSLSFDWRLKYFSIRTFESSL